MFRTFPLSIIGSLFTVHSAMVYVIRVCRQLLSRSICSCSKSVHKPVWHTPLLSVQWINSCCWTDELSETCRVSCQNKFVKLVHLVGFITKRFVTMNGHMKVKKYMHNIYSLHTFLHVPVLHLLSLGELGKLLYQPRNRKLPKQEMFFFFKSNGPNHNWRMMNIHLHDST